MKTLELLNGSESEIAPKLKALKIKELEAHSKKLSSKLGADNYDVVLAAVIKVVPQLKSGQDGLSIIKSIVAEQILLQSKMQSVDAHVLERLAIVMMVLVTKKFLKIHKEQYGDKDNG